MSVKHLSDIYVDGKIGIGTQSPGADLHIEDAGNSSSGIRIEAIGSANTDTVNMHFQGQAGKTPGAPAFKIFEATQHDEVDGFEPHSFTHNVFGKFTTHLVL